MCQLTAYIVKDEQQELVLEDVTVVQVHGTHLHLSSLFGESREVEGSITRLESNQLLIAPAHTHASPPLQGDAQKLAVLLDHWVEHNGEHNRELERWAQKAEALGEAETWKEMRNAAAKVEEANLCLRRAAEKLGRTATE